MRTIFGTTAAALALAMGGPAHAAYVEVWNVMTANPFGAQVVVEDVRYADGGVDAPSRPVGRTLLLGDGTVVAFTVVTQSGTGGLAFAVQCAAEASYGKVEIENPWTVVASGACQLARRGTIVPGNMIRWD
ncbi:MAG: hypothetical protein IT561_17120 [Alphaproteobacteria bacterium]|nr:hypothetical protein [Alphaproteobacteria bacterium]